MFMRYRILAQSACLGALAYAGMNGRLIVDKDGKRSSGAGGDIVNHKMPPGIPPPPPGE
eukprot:CAMPEP_0184479060 /NCGR_PEP_ID=MMETSP0113_2-20130426/919_1 /TAXON_ID=91329 /ORGANISM="Norrisiella sphaerica, Strain BC52" /LENGTH=58 /DNA_ID=CAMNT_0026857053 /DNA_START=297 /DNA_END=473 /DNA_ORIENTATION=+